MKHTIFSFLALLYCFALQAQNTLHRPTFSAGGNNAKEFTFTLGESIALFRSHTAGSLSIGAQPGDDKKGVNTDEVDWAKNVSLFPNPTEGFLFVQVDEGKSLSANIYDNTGRWLFDLNLQQGLNFLDLCDYPSGVYHLMIYTDAHSKTWQIVKH